MSDHSSVNFDSTKESQQPEEEHYEEEEEEDKGSSSSEEEQGEEEGEMEDDESDYDPWSMLSQKVGEDVKEPYMKEVQQFLDRGKTQDYAKNAAFNTLLPLSKRRLRRTYLEHLKWTHCIKHDAIHHQVMKTLQYFIDEDDMDFYEAAESAVAKRKFLLNSNAKEATPRLVG